MNKRVVVTGLGAVTPLGNDISTFWQNVVEGKSGAGRITRFDPSAFRTQIACEVRDFDPTQYLDRNEIKRSDLFTQYALHAAGQAIEDSGFDLNNMSPFDVGVIWGSGQGGMDTFEKEVGAFKMDEQNPRFSPFFIPKLIVNMAAGMISMKYGFMGMSYVAVSACSTSNTALMDAMNYIRMGKAKIIVTGGSEAPVTTGSIGGFSALKAMSTRNEDPEVASRPFDTQRDGFLMGEGGGALILEEYEHAKARGAKIYAEVAGSAMTSDAYHMTASHPKGLGALKAMQLAMEDAQVNVDEVNYLNTHATSTPVGDISETYAIHKLIGDGKNQLQISATKSMTGHLLGAAGAAEGIISILALKNGVVPPTINTEELDPAIPNNLNIVTREAREMPLKVAMSNTFGFGGHNAIVVFKKI
ncbi:MAG TPA: beta-ketoacyl-[acyl-carrier-protein] synthase II [Cytophagales bacterium]|jgi:3-oxoacyl-[acyl-carrier-protein] synthase II|nr:beta-ketoacyl-[acyl-carrier-protein] synthase II [Cytophagales bacterium]